MKLALIGLVLIGATACTLTEREVLLTAHGVPVTVAVSGRQTCIEIDDDARMGSWCRPADRVEAVWIGATWVGDGLVVVGQAPAEVVSVTLAGEGGLRSLAVEQTGQGRFFVGEDVPPGDYEVAAEREDGSEYVSGDVSMRGRGTTTGITMTP
jgi:hypothetical protein